MSFFGASKQACKEHCQGTAYECCCRAVGVLLPQPVRWTREPGVGATFGSAVGANCCRQRSVLTIRLIIRSVLALQRTDHWYCYAALFSATSSEAIHVIVVPRFDREYVVELCPQFCSSGLSSHCGPQSPHSLRRLERSHSLSVHLSYSCFAVRGRRRRCEEICLMVG